MELFKKVAVMTDLHVGLKNNSQVHLQDCEDFIDWFIIQAKKEGCDIGIFTGDWSHHRNSINLITLDTSIRCLEKLGAAFDQFFWFPGNHDLFYKDRREIHSTEFAKHIPGVTVVNEITTLDEVTLVPWMIEEEWKNISQLKSRYMFGHFELPLFYMNAMVQMPDHGQIQLADFKNQEYVFSGHFHKRQNKGNIWYIGNAFPHNCSDTWDDDRGMMVLEWGKTPKFISWPDAPKFRTLNLSKLIDEKDSILKSKMYLKVNLDIDISYEEAFFLKETFTSEYDIREFNMNKEHNSIDSSLDENTGNSIKNVDQIVIEGLLSIDSNQFDQKILLEIYQNL